MGVQDSWRLVRRLYPPPLYQEHGTAHDRPRNLGFLFLFGHAVTRDKTRARSAAAPARLNTLGKSLYWTGPSRITERRGIAVARGDKGSSPGHLLIMDTPE